MLFVVCFKLARFNATALLERLRGKRLVFVGDSLNRGQWVSMVCLLESSIPSTHKSMHTNGSLTTFKALVTFFRTLTPINPSHMADDYVNKIISELFSESSKYNQSWAITI